MDLILQDGVEVVFFLSPYHPLVYRHLVHSEEYRIVTDVEGYFRSVAAKKGIRIIGSYDPARIGLTESDFYDGMHPKPEAVRRLFQ